MVIGHTLDMARLIEPVIPPGSMRSLSQSNLEVDDLPYLRPWTLDDGPVVVAAYNDPDIQWWMPYSYDEDQAEELIEKWTETWKRETGACWAIAKRSDNAVFGRIAFQTIDFISGSAEISYWVLSQSRGEGFAARATSALCDWGFNQFGLHRVQLFHSLHNIASCRVAVKAGFELEATLKSETLFRDGWHDTHLHARIRPAESPVN